MGRMPLPLDPMTRLLSLLAAAVLFLAAPQTVRLIGGGLAPDLQAVAADLVRLMAAATVFLGVSGVLTGLLYAMQSFTRPAFVVVVFNAVLVGALVETGVIKALATEAMQVTNGNVTTTAMLILWMSAIASAFIDNIPFVATLIPLIQDMGQMGLTNLDPMWWSLSLGACLGGNGTLIGASANVVVASMAAQRGKQISFLGFMKVAFPVMILTIIISSAYVWIRYL